MRSPPKLKLSVQNNHKDKLKVKLIHKTNLKRDKGALITMRQFCKEEIKDSSLLAIREMHITTGTIFI